MSAAPSSRGRLRVGCADSALRAVEVGDRLLVTGLIHLDGRLLGGLEGLGADGRRDRVAVVDVVRLDRAGNPRVAAGDRGADLDRAAAGLDPEELTVAVEVAAGAGEGREAEE